MKAPSRIAKSVVITNLVNSIRDSATEQGGGGFVRFDSSSGLWYEVGEKIARDKVGQALRDAARLQSEKRKSITIDSSSSSSSSSHPHRDDGRFPLAEPSITPSTTPDNTVAMVKQERSGQSVLKWTHNEDSERLSPSSAPTIAKNDSGADNNSSSFWFRQNTTAMPRTRGTTQHSSTTDEEVMAAFAESLEGDISSHNQRHQQQARTGSPSIMLFSSERVLSPLPSSSIPSSSSLEGIEAADALLEWFENDI
ncbi:unnamed protein product [Cylindrotheca closterium]|uniref:DUF6824 domain-containing protein n=1 Tax=Cylindrotheca closterium TaxID=2856 RepID=A0AAD2FG17_9STRA|nr:unnamed protein product [Cylindrotheca closterium]